MESVDKILLIMLFITLGLINIYIFHSKRQKENARQRILELHLEYYCIILLNL